MPEHIKANIGAESVCLDRKSNGKWENHIRAPSMPGEYKITLDVSLFDGNSIRYEPSQRVIVKGKHFDLRQYGKLSERLIKRIILSNCGYVSHVIFIDSMIRIIIKSDNYNEAVINTVRKMLLPKIPMHIKLSVEACENVQRHLIMWRDVKQEFSSWAEIAGNFPDWQSVMYYRSSDCAIWSEIKTGFHTWADVARKYKNWDEVQIYAPVAPFEEGL